MVSTTLGGLKTSTQATLYAQGFQCDHCKTTYTDNQEAISHCSACQYDICGLCSAQMISSLECDSGHSLHASYTSDLAAENASYTTGYTCDTCGNNTGGYPVRHCSICSFDVCPNCVKQRLGYPTTPQEPQPGVHPHIHHPTIPPIHHHLAGAPLPLLNYNNLTQEWSSVMTEAGISQDVLRVNARRQSLLETVRVMMGEGTERLNELPELSFIPLQRRDVVARLRSWWRTQQVTGPGVPVQSVQKSAELPDV